MIHVLVEVVKSTKTVVERTHKKGKININKIKNWFRFL